MDYDKKKFNNLRVKREDYKTIANYAYEKNINLAACVDQLVREWIEQNVPVEMRYTKEDFS